MTMSDSVLATIDRAGLMLAKVQTPAEVKHVANIAETARVWAKRTNAGAKTVNYAVAVKLKCERRLGQILEAMPKRAACHSTGGGSKGSSRKPLLGAPAKLSDIGVSKRESSRAQQVARVEQSKFDAKVAQVEASEVEVPTVKIIKELTRERTTTRAEIVLTGDSRFVSSLADLVGEKFACIYADPPWSYDNQGTRASTDNHYPTLSIDALCKMPIRELCAANCHLHLWTTNAFLFECPNIFEAWGFEFKSSFVWVKPQIGIGNYWRCAHEFLLLGVRGKLTAASKNLKSWAELDRAGHSEKPEAVRGMLQQLSPAPRLELFGRKSVNGWTVFGNEVTR